MLKPNDTMKMKNSIAFKDVEQGWQQILITEPHPNKSLRGSEDKCAVKPHFWVLGTDLQASFSNFTELAQTSVRLLPMMTHLPHYNITFNLNQFVECFDTQPGQIVAHDYATQSKRSRHSLLLDPACFSFQNPKPAAPHDYRSGSNETLPLNVMCVCVRITGAV